MRNRGSHGYGIALHVAGVLFQALGLVALSGIYVVFWPALVRHWLPLILILPGIGALRLGHRIALHGRRLSAGSVRSTERFGHNSFVIYLRSFADDTNRQNQWAPWVHFATAAAWALTSGLTEEEQLVAALRPIGPVLAVSNPRDRRPYAGARRLRLSDWQPEVIAEMQRARLVVLAVGTGRGLIWEYVQARLHVQPARLMLVAMSRSIEYERFRWLAAGELAAAGHKNPLLPPQPEYPLGPFIIRFREDWSAELICRPTLHLGRNLVKWAIVDSLTAVVDGLIATDMAAGRVHAARRLRSAVSRQRLWPPWLRQWVNLEVIGNLLVIAPFALTRAVGHPDWTFASKWAAPLVIFLYFMLGDRRYHTGLRNRIREQQASCDGRASGSRMDAAARSGLWFG